MPIYSSDIKEILYEEDVSRIYNCATKSMERVLVSLLWITGARTTEIIMLQAKAFDISDHSLSIVIPTLKRGKKEGGDFDVRERTLNFKRPKALDMNIYIETIIEYVKMIPMPEQRIFKYKSRWAEKTINKLGMDAIQKKICPYHFRHSVLSWLAKNGATVSELMFFKGAKNISSVSPYLAAVPFEVNLQRIKRDRSQSGQEIQKRTEPDFVSENK